MRSRSSSTFALWCAATIFIGAFLLFQIQPIISKIILPWFGGSPAVWTTCLLFFQLLLLGGYAYADLLFRWASIMQQAAIHAGLAVVAVLTLPISPNSSWEPADGTYPTLRILSMLTISVGLPYFLLSATSPLAQSWFSRVYSQRSPYRLYALSNIGSLGALLSYPFLFEPWLTTRRQDWLWSGAFVIYALLCGNMAWLLWRQRSELSRTSKTARQSEQAAAPPIRPTWRDWAAWILFPALATLLLLAVTNHLCQDVAVIPLLWIAPLSLYLLTFIVCFDREAWYSRLWYSLAGMAAILAATYLTMAKSLKSYFVEQGLEQQWQRVAYNVRLEIAIYLALLLLVCLVCHGELVRRKPHSRFLTGFYLSISGGGALGGLLVSLVAPRVFSTFFELNLGIVIAFVMCVVVAAQEIRVRWLKDASPLLKYTLAAAALIVPGIVGFTQFLARDSEPCIARHRNFYGVVSVKERFRDEPEQHGTALYHGDTLHGYQFCDPEKRLIPTSYYHQGSGVGRVLRNFRVGQPRRIGVIGLGVGTLATYGGSDDTFRFYEINPLVVELAQQHFTFLRDSHASIEFVPGDARLTMRDEVAQNYDVLVVDAFSGDTIPVHLLTKEAFEIYLKHLSEDGLLLVHVSNRYLDLAPVMAKVAEHFELHSAYLLTGDHDRLGKAPATWVALSRKDNISQLPDVAEIAGRLPRAGSFPLWTDQYNNLFQILR